MSGLSERIKALVDSSGLSMRELSRRMNLNPVSLSQWVKDQYEPSREGISALCEYFKVSPAWLRYGEGPAPDEADAGTIPIPLYNVEASCGHGSAVDEPESIIRKIFVSREFLRRYAPGANPNSLHIIRASGDSMSPTIEDGDSVVVDISDRSVRRDGIYAIQINGNLLIKRVQILPNGIRMLSDNPHYPPYEVTGEQESIVIVGRCHCGAFLRGLA